MIAFTVYGSPKPAGSKRAFVRGGRAVVTDANPASKPWKQHVTEAAIAYWCSREAPPGVSLPVFPDGPVCLHLQFTLKRPKTHYLNGVLRPNAPTWHTNKPDALKLARGVEDALTGVLYRDDAQTAVYAWKVYGDQECVEVSAWGLE